jgi:hypothetical protein
LAFARPQVRVTVPYNDQGTLKGQAQIKAASKQSLPLKSWMHVAIVFENTTLRIFLNGKLDSEFSGQQVGASRISKDFVFW